MLVTLRHSSRIRVSTSHRLTRSIATHTSSAKRAGDISDAFASLSGKEFTPLDPSYATLKKNLLSGREDAVSASWKRLLRCLQEEIPQVIERGSKTIPEIQFKDIMNTTVSKEFSAEHRRRGVAVVRGVIDEKEARGYKTEIEDYIRKNPHTKGKAGTSPFFLFMISRSHISCSLPS